MAEPRKHAGPTPLCADTLQAVTTAARGGAPVRVEDVRERGGHTNEVYEIRLCDGTLLIVKRGRHAWSGATFETSRSASVLLRGSGVLVPEPLPLDAPADGPALQAYWRIPACTLASRWPDLDDTGREQAMRSLAKLLHRLHGTRLPGWGELRAAQRGPRALHAYLEHDLGERLLPAARWVWPTGGDAIRELAAAARSFAGAHGTGPGTLAHNDLHLDNILCEADDEGVRCVGFLDLDSSAAVPPESDVARLQVLHGPLFNQEIPPRWTELVADAYPGGLEPGLTAFFRGFHLGNLGFHAALIGDGEHASRVADALREEVATLPRSA